MPSFSATCQFLKDACFSSFTRPRPWTDDVIARKFYFWDFLRFPSSEILRFRIQRFSSSEIQEFRNFVKKIVPPNHNVVPLNEISCTPESLVDFTPESLYPRIFVPTNFVPPNHQFCTPKSVVPPCTPESLYPPPQFLAKERPETSFRFPTKLINIKRPKKKC
ncbi:Protein CBG27469 [Caenorhabditis briggsae]|uniref:Protein CBG27469 n=1 Tax=Caenorhabditis briggsae TaxID=6238 RepID=B6IK46_CAEBR|nr:Protein CBG27469 [Caenorhabditis briggsae]CAS00276.1 Protein CBG27469 [Caenorhabditis briggsae]